MQRRPAPYFRHGAAVRVMHWINAAAALLLLMSGLQIFNAHPALNWGKQSYDGRAPVLAISARRDGEESRGITTVFGREFDTTGVLGVSATGARAFPGAVTIPSHQSLAEGRRWHFFFAWILVLNGVAYVVYSALTRHWQQDLWPTRAELKRIGRSLLDHLGFRHPTGDAAKRYNVLQKLTYVTVIGVLLPGTVLMGLAMSPTLDALLPGWVDVVGGRQSARTLHFVGAMLLVLFVLVHVFEVIVTGPVNNLRSMITGWYRVPPPPPTDEEAP